VAEWPVLTARWTELALLNFRVPVEEIARLAPAGTEPDLHAGEAYISVVGFRFQSVRIFGIPVPGHTRFDEINLRYYVKREVGGEVRRGVVFVREIVPRRAVAIVANRLYNENYVTRPMRRLISMAGEELSTGDRIEYGWHDGGGGAFRRRKARDWNRLAADVATPLEIPAAGSLEEFIVEHYWGYGSDRHGRTIEYRVAHPTWRVSTAVDMCWECDVESTYRAPFARYLMTEPASAIIAEGSAVQVFGGRRLETKVVDS
jgi:uncharacterized protein